MSDVFSAVCHNVLHVAASEPQMKKRMSIDDRDHLEPPVYEANRYSSLNLVGIAAIDIYTHVPIDKEAVVGGDDWFVQNRMAMRLRRSVAYIKILDH
jgi:hypothetical protein